MGKRLPLNQITEDVLDRSNHTGTRSKSLHNNKELHLFIGQSNMKSDNSGPVLINKDDAPDPRIFDVSRGITYEGNYAPAVIGEKHIAQVPDQNVDTPSTSNSVSMSMSFAKQRIALNDGIEEITYINSAVGNTGFSQNRWNKGDDLYNISVDQVKDFLYKNPEYTLTSIQWHQGESDALTLEDANLYEGRLIAMINDLRKDFGYIVPFVLGTMRSDWIGTDQARVIVDNVHKNIPNLVTLTSTVDMSDLGGIPNNVHFDAPSLRIAGRRYANNLQELILSDNYIIPVKSYISNRSNNYKHVFNPTVVNIDSYNNILVTGDSGKNTSMKFNGQASTKMAWIRPNTNSPVGLNKNIISGYKFSDLSGSLNNAHFLTSSSYAQGLNGGLNDNNSNFRDTINLDLNAWYHVAVTFDGDNLKTYLNGVETSTDGGTNNLIIEDGIVTLGNLTFQGNTSNAFNMFIDDIRIYPFSLTESQILEVASIPLDQNLNLADTSWSDLILTTGLTGQIEYKRKNGRIIIEGSVNNNTGNEITTLGTLPSDFRPSRNRRFIVNIDDITRQGLMFSGQMLITIPTNTVLAIDIEFTQDTSN